MAGWQTKGPRALALALRLLLGAVFLYAAWTKLRLPWQLFAMTVDAYGLLPQWAVIAVARALPWGEIAIGVMLIAGVFPRVTSCAASLLLLGFLAVMAKSYLSGLQIDCGCFGAGDTISPRTLARDSALLLVAVAQAILAWRLRRQPAAPPSLV